MSPQVTLCQTDVVALIVAQFAFPGWDTPCRLSVATLLKPGVRYARPIRLQRGELAHSPRHGARDYVRFRWHWGQGIYTSLVMPRVAQARRQVRGEGKVEGEREQDRG